jgi:hypothetical protein
MADLPKFIEPLVALSLIELIHEAATEKRGFQAVSSKEGFSALIRHGKTVIEISGDDFAVRQTD